MNDPVRIGRAGKLTDIQDIFYMDALGESGPDGILVFIDQLDDAAADCAESKYCDLYHGIASFLFSGPIPSGTSCNSYLFYPVRFAQAGDDRFHPFRGG